MKIDIKREGKTETIELTIRGRDTKAAIKEMQGLNEAEDESQAVMQWIAWRDKKLSELSGLSVDELDDLPTEEKQKLVQAFTEAIENESGFTKR